MWILIQNVFQRITGEPGKGRIDGNNAFVRIGHQDPAGTGIQHCAGQLHGGFIFSAFGDVFQYDHNAADITVFTPEWLPADKNE